MIVDVIVEICVKIDEYDIMLEEFGFCLVGLGVVVVVMKFKWILLLKYLNLKMGEIWSGCGWVLVWFGKNCGCFLIKD